MSKRAGVVSIGRGRPKSEVETVSIHVRTPKHIADWLEVYAEQNGLRTRQEAINFLLADKYKKTKNKK